MGEELKVIWNEMKVNGSKIYNGYMFVKGVLLREKGMRKKKVKKMKERKIMRVME